MMSLLQTVQRSALPALLITVSSLILAGCGQPATTTTPATTSTPPNTGAVKADQKVGDTTVSGTVTKAGENYLLSIPGKPTKAIDSYKIKLGEYVGKSVTVTGQYSGDTLFVSKID